MRPGRAALVLCAAAVAAPLLPRTGCGQGAEPVRARATPRSIRLVTVPMPPELSIDRGVAYTIVSTGQATIIGPLNGVIVAGGEGGVTVVVSLAAGTAAGERHAATVLFFEGGVLRAEVPVTLEVERVREAALRLAQPLYGARPGDGLAIRYVLTNQGNGRDTLELTALAPAGWALVGAPARHVLEAGEGAAGELRVTVPRRSPTGALRVRLAVRGTAGEVAQADARIEVLEASAASRSPAPRLVAGVASVLGDSTASNPVFGFQLEGPVAEGIHISGRLVEPLDRRRTDARGLARVGYFVGAPYVTLSGQGWEVTGGTTGRSFGDLTGVNLYGHGGSISYAGPSWSFAALAARPPAAPGGPEARGLFGAQLGVGVGQGRVTGTVTDLADPQFAGRRLYALGLGGITPPFHGITVSGEMAYREYTGGQGIGWVAELRHRAGRDRAELRVVSAPGGSAAFASARRQLSAAASRHLGPRLALGAGYWTSDDDNPVFSTLHTAGWSLAPRLAVSEHVAVELEARSTSFDAAGPAGAFGNGETLVRLGLTAQSGAFVGSGSLTVGRTSRDAAIPGGPSSETSASRQAARGGLTWASDRGVFEASVMVERNGAGVGFFPRQYVVGARADRVALASGWRSPMLNAEFHRYGWFGDRPGVTVIRAGVEIALLADLAVTIDVERNPFVSGVGGRARWVPAVKLARAVRLPVGGPHPGTRGVVYQDLNGNGVRDRGEPPVRGVIVRHGAETIVTDASGRFRSFERTNAPARVDETSLPFGLVANPDILPPAPRRRLELGVIPTVVVEVRLVRTADQDGRIPSVDLTGVPVRARDPVGAVWSARADSTGVVRFHALPPGDYQLEFDFSGLREPVRLRQVTPTFRVVPGREAPTIRVPVYPRPVRLFETGGTRRDGEPSR